MHVHARLVVVKTKRNGTKLIPAVNILLSQFYSFPLLTVLGNSGVSLLLLYYNFC